MMQIGVVLIVAALGVSAAIHTEDVDRFYRIYDAASGHPSAEQAVWQCCRACVSE
jgi:hypothetical protein